MWRVGLEDWEGGQGGWPQRVGRRSQEGVERGLGSRFLGRRARVASRDCGESALINWFSLFDFSFSLLGDFLSKLKS